MIQHLKDIQWYDADLTERLQLATAYICRMLDKDKDEEPFFGIIRTKEGTAFANHSVHIGIPHVTGRALDALFYTEEITGERIPEHGEHVYTRYLIDCCSNEDCLPSYYDPDQENKRFVEFHNLREGLEGLTWLIKLRNHEAAAEIADGFVDIVYRLTDFSTGALSYDLTKKMGREKEFATIQHPYPLVQGRLVGAMLKYYRETGNLKALKLCAAHSRSTMQHCFSPEGLIQDQAANHIHSITSSLSGILEYAILAKDPILTEQIRKVYEIGLREFYSSYGWCKEQAWLETDQGEVNQVGDLIQIQLLLAAHLDRNYYSHAEIFMRSSLLPSQVLKNDFVEEVPSPAGDHECDMKERMIGGFGFPTPSSHLQKEDSAINTIDITQGAVQAICEFTKHIITESEWGIMVNLLFSWENNLAEVRSDLPKEGRIVITPKAAKNILVRIPERTKPSSLQICVDNEPVAFLMMDRYAVIRNLQVGLSYEVKFIPETCEEDEFIYHKPYQVRWHGEQVIGISPVEGIYSLYEGIDGHAKL
ncbi:hypothetical protein [Paenibacillus sp. GCM10027626]|uniref:hypothetical protein n=1 Tax=Paenibacillus sp. GCM10027626 TaxID=3273411 RepID=UPI00363E84FF